MSWEVFLASVPMDSPTARATARCWQDAPISDIRSLRNVKTWLKLIEPGVEYLAEDQRASLSGWLKLLPMLP